MGPRRRGCYQAGGWWGRLERQPGHEGEKGVGSGQSGVGKSEDWYVAGQSLGQQAGHALTHTGHGLGRLEGVARHGRRGSGGCGQQVWNGGGLLGGRGGTQAGVLAADG